MADAARTFRAAAYEFGSAAAAYDEVYEEDTLPKVDEAVKPQERTPVKTKVDGAGRNKIGISIVAIIGIPAVLLSSVAMLSRYTELTRLSDESVELEQQIETLEREQSRLRILYESTFEMEDVETYAKNVLGMVKADGEQNSYIRSAQDDRVQKMESAKTGRSLGSRIRDIWRSIREYLS